MNAGLFLFLSLFVIKAIQYPVLLNVWHTTLRPRKKQVIALVIILSLVSDLILLWALMNK